MFKTMEKAEAHCDIPCKIYDPAIAQVAGLSVVRLIDLLHEIDPSDSTLKSEAHKYRFKFISSPFKRFILFLRV